MNCFIIQIDFIQNGKGVSLKMNQEMQLPIKTTVKASYKSGTYIGEVVDSQPTRTLIKILAVVHHPKQGDLHHPYQGDVDFFHQRKALAYLEKAWMPNGTLSKFNDEVPDYRESLLLALQEEMEETEKQIKDPIWSKRALKELQELKAEYKL